MRPLTRFGLRQTTLSRQGARVGDPLTRPAAQATLSRKGRGWTAACAAVT